MIHETGQLLSGMAAMLVALVAAMKFIQDRSEKRIKRHQEATIHNTMRDVLRSLAAQTMRQIEGIPPEKIFSLDVRLRSGEQIHVPLLAKTWIQYLPSLSLMLIRSCKTETEMLMDVLEPAFLPWHSHTESEAVTVIRGRMIDLQTGHIYGPGETWEIPAESWHRAQFDAGTLCRIIVRPPLETAATRPIDLSHMPSAFAYEEEK
jgi:quercetin dioxygenase-like cupin family protein